MAYQQQSEQDLAELQKLSNEYEPEVTVSEVKIETLKLPEVHQSADHDLHQGPLVGQREPSTAITTEYASADPVFQAKTAVSLHR